MFGKSTKTMTPGDSLARTAEMTAMWKSGNMDAMKLMLADDVVCVGASSDRCADIPFFGVFTGKSGFEEMLTGMMTTVDFAPGIDFSDHVVDGNVVTRAAHFEMTVKATGKKIKGTEMQRFEWDARTGLLARMLVFADTDKVKEAFSHSTGGITSHRITPAPVAKPGMRSPADAIAAAAELTGFWKIGNMEGMLDLCAEDIICVGQHDKASSVVPFFGDFHGHSGWKEMMAGFGPDVVEFKTIDFTEHVAVNSTTVLRMVHAEMRFVQTGATITNTEMHRFDFNEAGKCTRFQLYSDSDKILKAMTPHGEPPKKAKASDCSAQ